MEFNVSHCKCDLRFQRDGLKFMRSVAGAGQLSRFTIKSMCLIQYMGTDGTRATDPFGWLALPEFREVCMSQPTGVESPLALAKRLSLPFEDNPYLLTRALTHTSYLNEHEEVLDDNERLEFLGDAVLDFLVGAWLYKHCPEMREGELTKARSALVRTETLARFARQIDLGQAMRLGKGEQRAGGANRPALLCATFEALVGAIYLEKGLEAVKDFFFPFLDASHDDILSGVALKDVKSYLQEWTQGEKMGLPRYVTVDEQGPDHAKIFEVEVYIGTKVYGRGSGKSKSVAAQLAAQETLKMLGIIS